MSFLKKLCKFLLKFAIILVILVVLVVGGFFLFYLFTMQSALDYLPENFLLYINIDSLKDIYEKLIDLKAADVIFSSGDLKSVYLNLLEFKSNEFSRNGFLKMLLEFPASIIVHEDYSLTIALDPGFISVITRNIDFINVFFKFDGLNLTIIQKGKNTIYSMATGPSDALYFSMVNNLVFLSTKQKNIENLFINYATKKNLRGNVNLAIIKGKAEKQGFLELYASTSELLESLFGSSPEAKPLLESVEFNPLSVISFFVSNDELKIGMYTGITPREKSLGEFLDYNPADTGILRYLPYNTNVLTSLSIKSLKDLYNVLVAFQGRQITDTFGQVEGATKMLLGGMTVDDLVFNWTGEEMGAFLTGRQPDPIVFIKIRNRDLLQSIFKKLTDSMLLDQDDSLVFNNIRLSRITFPPLVAGIVDMFVKGFSMPYFIIQDDYIFFCMDAETLSQAILAYKNDKVITRTLNFKVATGDLPKNANIFSYYDLSTSLPPMVERGSLPAQLLSLYEAGAVTVSFGKKDLAVSVSAYGIAGNKTKPFPGFPVTLTRSTTTDVLFENVRGSSIGELVYVDNNNYLVIQELTTGTTKTVQVYADCRIMAVPGSGNGYSDILVYSGTGAINRIDGEGKSVAPFPKYTEYKNSFMPVQAGVQLLLYSRNDRALVLVPVRGGNASTLVKGLESEVLAPPSYSGGLYAYYPKSLEAQVFLADQSGRTLPGWPVVGGGVSFSSPVIAQNSSGQTRVIFVSQSGRIDVWDTSGKSTAGFPFSVFGSYFADPVMMSLNRNQPRAIALLSESGLVTIVDQQAEQVKQKMIENAGDRKSRMLAYDIDSDGIDELFIYGAKNYIIGLDSRLEMLPGFPVTGGRKPAFANLGNDAKPEMIVAGFDDKLYVYELAK